MKREARACFRAAAAAASPETLNYVKSLRGIFKNRTHQEPLVVVIGFAAKDLIRVRRGAVLLDIFKRATAHFLTFPHFHFDGDTVKSSERDARRDSASSSAAQTDEGCRVSSRITVIASFELNPLDGYPSVLPL
ncbi:hypothetical protein F2P81_004162 [Scophthalmus maximus]|uniref:Uncharacterized protein n=1 Tax=Scophthalmus maximus TaxID=52904 RepID=A0A6A4TC47_SCOMX|nr:hypothetical protein F2P81_004162 [Scophthalmus maximus]